MSLKMSNLKVSMPDNYRRIFTLDDIDSCKAVLSSILAGYDDGKLDLSSEVVSALSLASDSWASADGVYEVSVEYAKNGRLAWDHHGDGTGIMDLWVKVKGFVGYSGFYMVEFYLSDIWSLGGDNRDEVKSHMYIRKFVEIK